MAWADMATSNYEAANDLFDREFWRSCVSRAYYAVYGRLTGVLIHEGVQMPARGNPGHEQLQKMVLNNLNRLSLGIRAAIHGMLARLYWLRVMADYGPDVTIESDDARNGLGFMAGIFRLTTEVA